MELLRTLPKKKALVTGGAGFIGSHLAEELARRGYRVIILDDLSTGKMENIEPLLKKENVEFIQGSITDLALLQRVFKALTMSSTWQLSPTSLGVQKNPLASHDANITGTLNVLLAARSGATRGQSISELRQEITQLRAELEQETAKGLELESSRDVAWEAFQIVAGKVVEAEVAVRAQDAVVRVAEVAVVPEQPVAPRRVMNIGIALVLGLVVGVFGAFGVEYFQKTGDKPEGGKREQEVS